MEEELVKLEITKEDLQELSAEEIVDIKLKLEELLMECEEILQEDVDIEQ